MLFWSFCNLTIPPISNARDKDGKTSLKMFGVFVLHSKTFITLTYPVFLAVLEINHECPCCLFRHDLFGKNI